MKKSAQKDSGRITHLAVNTIKTLSMDAIQKANSGHPGMPMGAADYACILWSRYLRHNPADPEWPDRDRFVLSAGHGSMLLYSLMHMSGYRVSINDIKNFRQWDSITPGHPEKGCFPGIETTTGPLGQGFANGVGMAIAAKMTAARFNTKKRKIVTHKIWGIVGDGDMMEGISTEAASMAGHLKLNNIIYIYDDNKITIDGKTGLTFSEDIWKKYQAMGWRVIWTDGHDHERITEALDKAIEPGDQPTLIIAASHIACGSPGKQDTSDAHGAPLGEDEILATKKNIGWKYKQKFFVPKEVYGLFKDRDKELKSEYRKWKRELSAWEKENSRLAKMRTSMLDKVIPGSLEKILIKALPDKPVATRAISGAVLQATAKIMPGLCGGSADLAPSNKTYIQGSEPVSTTDFSGRNFHFGIREHAMGAALNGMALYGGFIPYGGTFLVFSDYMKTPIRLAALMEQQVIYVFTHDSFYVGEDGPTHQPIEHLAMLRSIPNVHLFRPADGVESAIAWASAIRRTDGPTILSLTRQGVPVIKRPAGFKSSIIKNGGYVVHDAASGKPDMTIVAAGSEVGLAIETKKLLGKSGKSIRIVSIPCMELFDSQPESYRKKVIPPDCEKLVAMEAGSAMPWYKYVGKDALMITLDHFGASAPGKELAVQFGFTPEKAAKRINEFFSM